MTLIGWMQILLFALAVLLVTKPLGIYIVKVYDGSLTWLRPVERLIYRVSGVREDEEQHWTTYTTTLLFFSLITMLVTYIALRLQHVLPLNPESLPAVPDRQSFETAASF